MSIKEVIKSTLDEKLVDFELVDGGQQRTVGDLIENKVAEILFSCNHPLIVSKKKARSKKSIEDLTLITEEKTYYIDPKTHNLNSDFSMPNLTSVQKLKKLFGDNNKELVYVFVDYVVENKNVKVKNIKVFYIWELDSEILGVGALGKGQLQIKNANKEITFTTEGKEIWYEKFKKLVQNYLAKQIVKINKQIVEWN